MLVWLLGLVKSWRTWLYLGAVALVVAGCYALYGWVHGLEVNLDQTKAALKQAQEANAVTTASLQAAQGVNARNEAAAKTADQQRQASAALAQQARADADAATKKWSALREKLASRTGTTDQHPDPDFCSVVDGLHDAGSAPACP